MAYRIQKMSENSDSQTLNKIANTPRDRYRVGKLLLIGLFAGFSIAFAFSRLSLSQARISIELRQHLDARKTLNFVASFWPKTAEWYYLNARCHRRLGEPEVAKRLLKKAEIKGWSEADIEWEETLGRIQAGAWRTEPFDWDDLIRNAGSDGPEICKAYVQLALGQFRIDDARRVLSVWKKDFPGDADAYRITGRLEEAYLKWKDAAAAYKTAIDLEPHDSALQISYARCLSKLGKLDDAISILKSQLNNESVDVEAFQLLAESQFQNGLIDESAKTIEQGLSRFPNDLKLMKSKCSIQTEEGQFKAALPMLEKLVAEYPADIESHFLYGRALKVVGESEKAKKHIDLAEKGSAEVARLGILHDRLVQNPNNIELRYEIAMIYYRYKSRKEGIMWLKSLLQAFPNYEPAMEILRSKDQP